MRLKKLQKIVLSKVILITVLITAACVTDIPAEYYYTEFTGSLSTDWSNDLRYGQAGLFTNDATLDEDSVIQATGGKLSFSGSPHKKANAPLSEWEYNGTWIGNGVMLTNKRFCASELDPFGFDIKRTMASYGFNRTGEDRYQGENTVWLIQYEDLNFLG